VQMSASFWSRPLPWGLDPGLLPLSLCPVHVMAANFLATVSSGGWFALLHGIPLSGSIRLSCFGPLPTTFPYFLGRACGILLPADFTKDI
jgi:hypothetical protein